MRLKGLLLTYAIIVSITLSVQNAEATTITADDNIGGTVFLSTGSNITGYFDINSLLTSSSYNTPYDINSASILFSFLDDGDMAPDGSSLGSYYYSYTSGRNYVYYRDHINYYYDNYEEVRVTLPTGLTQATSPSYSSTQSQYGQTYDGSAYLGNYYYRRYYTNYYNRNSGYWGNFSLGMTLGVSELLDLSQDGRIYYTIYQPYGDAVFSNATLTADITANPLIGQGLTPTPEPASMLLLGTGLAGVAGAARRRKKNQA